MGGIKIARGSSRHSIEKKLQDLEEQKNKGNITLEEYDTLRIRYERKLGNTETVSKLQESKGFKPSKIKEKKVMKQELYDEFVDKYSKSDDKDYGQIQRSNMFSKSTKRTFIILFILLAFGVGIVAGFNVISNSQNQIQNNVTITDSAFSANATITNASNIVPANTSTVKYTKTKKTYNNYKKTNTSSSKSYSSSSSNSKNSYSNNKYSGSSGSGNSYSSNKYSSGSGSSGSGNSYRSNY